VKTGGQVWGGGGIEDSRSPKPATLGKWLKSKGW
jgi:hypothetical protein